MVIRIDKITTGRFGNKILQYNTLVQLGKIYDVSCSFVQNNEITNFFKNVMPYIPSKKPVKLLTCKMILDNTKLDFNNYEYKIDDPACCLHNVFYKLTKEDPRNFLVLKDRYKVDLSIDRLNIGIHIRGGDVITTDNGKEIHEFEYYKKSIEYVLKNYCENKKYMFYICTDDTNFKTYKQTYNYFLEKKIPLQVGSVVGNKFQYIKDWSILNNCNISINSSSTFCITAGYLNKKNPKIIHSEKWINRNINHLKWNDTGEKEFVYGKGYKIKDFWKTFDNFWIDVSKNNDYYYCDKLI
mgnify:CR=1 FL=1